MLQKNLNALRQRDPQLADLIEQTPVSDKTMLFVSHNGDPNMAYEDIALHRMSDALGEAKEVFTEEYVNAGGRSDGLAFIFGMGLGYLFKRTFVSMEGMILLFEPYLDVLRHTLSIVDFSEELASNRVKIIVSVEQILPAFFQYYLMGDALKTMALPAYRAKEPELFLAVLDELKSAMMTNIVGFNTQICSSEDFLRSSIQNLPTFLKYPGTDYLHDQFTGLPGVVVSAGPSLDKPGVLETLREHQSNVIISAVGTAAKALDKAGIIPDFISILEVQDVSSQLEGVSYLDKTTLVMLPQTNAAMFQFEAKRKLISYTMHDPLTHWLSHALKQSIYSYNHQGTVSISALILLMKMGCNPIFLVGQDLAFPEGKLYSNDSVYKDCRIEVDEQGERRVVMANKEDFYGEHGLIKDEADWLQRERQFFEGLTEVKGWQGESLFTRPTYDAFRKTFERIKLNHPGFNLVNCSQGGAFIQGYQHLPLNDAFQQYNVQEFEPKPLLESILSQNYCENAPDSEIYKKVYQQYLADREDLGTLQHVVEEVLELAGEARSLLMQTPLRQSEVTGVLDKMGACDQILVELTHSNTLINAYIKEDMYRYNREYGRKNYLNAGQSDETNQIEALLENIRVSEGLYHAIKKGVTGLMDTWEPVFKDFPFSTETHALGQMTFISPATVNSAEKPGLC